ncbi:hypothetical protein EOD41_01425 [Mucilaginibacter limnophilus]|uniref:Lipoprotein n=1 Tax=Mucilaginibacter limnophilus TaxID=1932778 RepID=A0A437MY95_9SPHI|nr:hypothetical protein [Mucilaginibacter limnophilus]RVU02628.1 hypothetical protein EOD41_01425 [Mucilaginibacter limnophilus]
MKTHMYKIYLAAAFCLVSMAFSACKKDERTIEADGLIIDLGNPAADGCGWAIQINNTHYKPEFLDEKFQQDSMVVRVDYKLLKNSYSCGIAANIGMPYIQVKQIKKK